MIIEINGKSLSDSCDVLMYYSKISNNQLLADLMNMNKLFTKKNGKIDVENIVTNDNFTNFFTNLYFAGRCAFENKLIPLAILKNELSLKLLMSLDFYNKMFEFIGGIMPDDKKKS